MADWYVDGNLGTDDAEHGTGPGDLAFKTIQYGIDDARVISGDTINVAEGTYVEGGGEVPGVGVTIDVEGLTLRSTGATENTIINTPETYAIYIAAENVTVDGFTVTGGDSGFEVEADHATLINNNVVNNYDSGIQVALWVYYCTLRGNTISNNGGAGILLFITQYNTIINNNISNNQWGVSFDIAYDNTLIGNIVSNNINGGFAISDAIGNILIGNTLSNNGGGCYKYNLGSPNPGNEIHLSNIVGNTEYGAWAQSPTESLGATNNWWGTAVEAEIVAMVDGDVTYSPWLYAPARLGTTEIDDVEGETPSIENTAAGIKVEASGATYSDTKGRVGTCLTGVPETAISFEEGTGQKLLEAFDVCEEGFTGGTAKITVTYAGERPGSNLRLYFWYGGAWNLGTDPGWDPATKTVWGTFDIVDLVGAPGGIGCIPDYENKGSLGTTVVVSRLPDQSGNLICDGVSDDIEINNALAYVNALGGGRVILKQGTYTLANPIVFPGNNIWLRGMGRSTFIDADGLPDAVGQHAIIVSGRTSCALKKVAIQTLDGSVHVNPHHCVFVENASDNLTIHDITIVDSDSDGVHIEGTNVLDIHIRGLRVDDVDDYGIYVDMTAGNWCTRLMIDGALILGAIIGMRLGDCQYSEVSNSVVAASTQTGINLDVCNYCDISNCISVLNTENGIIIAGATHCLAEGCNCSLNGYHGIYLDDSDECVVSGCVCSGNDSGNTGTYDGIYVDGDSTLNDLVSNHCCSNHRYGISVDGAQNSVMGNFVHANDLHGIYINATECKVTENYVTDNSQETAAAGTYHGIDLSGSADRCQINDNYCSDTGGDIQCDGIHLESGADDCQINDNYCYNGYHSVGAGNGITLTDNDNCLLKDNYCKDNDGYGIEIVAGSTNTVGNNKLIGNVTGQFSDGGTDTALPFIYEPVPNPDSFIGNHPAEELIDGVITTSRLSLHVPAEFQELVRIQAFVVAAAAGDMNYDVDTDYGKVCASEDYNAHGDAVADQIITCAISDIECADLVPATTLASLAASDLVGIEFSRDAIAVTDTIVGSVYLIGVRLQYV